MAADDDQDEQDKQARRRLSSRAGLSALRAGAGSSLSVPGPGQPGPYGHPIVRERVAEPANATPQVSDWMPSAIREPVEAIDLALDQTLDTTPQQGSVAERYDYTFEAPAPPGPDEPQYGD